MRIYEILDLAGLRQRRTLADAIAVFESQAAFGSDDKAEVRIGLIPLAARKSVGLVQVVFDIPGSDKSYAVPLPSAEFFRAQSPRGLPVRSSIDSLHQAIVDARGNVLLPNGQTASGVEIEPTHLPLKPSDLDWRIVHVALECCWIAKDAPFTEREVHEKCCRSIRDALRPEDTAYASTIPAIRFPDCNAVNDVWVPSLDSIIAHWREVYPDESAPSTQEIANTLADFRIRFPRRRFARAAPSV
jgi:hypothetical protein